MKEEEEAGNEGEICLFILALFRLNEIGADDGFMSSLRLGLPANYQPQRDSGLHREVNRQMADFLREIRLRAGMSQEALGKRIARHQKFVSDSEKALRRISICEFLEFCWGCDMDGAAAFTEFLSRTRFEVKPAKAAAPSAGQTAHATTKKKITSKR